ncbi:MAG: LemA family protein [Clostridiaceae bacterium]|jgi:LemA protein|nr:LemA family protein [Clostridiaceae bacterium]
MGYVILGIIVLLFIITVAVYNSLVGKRNKVRNSWSQIDVQLKRRFDLIPNLVETVKGYAAHEKQTLDAVISARSKFLSANTPEDMMKANGELSQVLGRLFAVSEAYPDLKANTNFIQLQEELTKTEDKIGYARQFYNDVVMEYNNAIQMFPASIIASMFGFKEEPFFRVEQAEREVPKVGF